MKTFIVTKSAPSFAAILKYAGGISSTLLEAKPVPRTVANGALHDAFMTALGSFAGDQEFDPAVIRQFAEDNDCALIEEADNNGNLVVVVAEVIPDPAPVPDPEED